MTTVRELVNDALLEIGIADDANNVPAEQAAHGLRVLNRMLGKWSQRGLLRPTALTVSVPLTGAGSYTIGPTGAVVATRPISVVSASYIDASGMESPIEVLNAYQWASIYDKALSAPVASVFYEATNTNGTIRVYPRNSGGSVSLQCLAVIASYASLNDTVTLPDGYEEALLMGLADALSGSYEKPTSPDIRRRLAAATRAIKAANAEPLLLSMELTGGNHYVIERGF